MVGKFLRNSGQCLNIKRQVGVLLWEHRGWILRMASLYKGRLLWPSADCQMVQTIRPETCGASFQTSEGEHQHALLFPNIEDSTFHHLPAKTGLSILLKSKIS